MVYGYIRVSTDKQDTQNQKIGIAEKAKQLGLNIDQWISDDGVSGAKEPDKRMLGKLLDITQKDDVIIVSEISRLGRKLFMVFRILENLMEKGVKLYSVKDAYNLDNTITSKVLAFAFGMAAEIERDMIQKRTKEGLARRRADGVILGRPVGRKSSETLLSSRVEELKKYLDLGLGTTAIARVMGCHKATVSAAIKQYGLREPESNPNLPDQFRKQVTPLLEKHLDDLKRLIEEEKTMPEIKEWVLANTARKKISITAIRDAFYELGIWQRFEEIQTRKREIANVDCGKYKR